MPFKRRGAAHEELTREENERINATLTHRSWHKLSVLRLRAEWYKLGATLEEIATLDHPVEDLVHEALQTSGAVGGEHRKDLVEAIKAQAPTPTVGLSMGTPEPPAEEAPKKKRGL